MQLLYIKVFFVAAAGLLYYAYSGYSSLLRLLAALSKKKHVRNVAFKPMVSILVPAYNEEKVIEQKIENCLSQDYPREKLQIIVCSDCSTDQTASIVSPYTQNHNVVFYDYRQRSGKTGIINKTVPVADGEIIVLTDANTMFEPDAVSKLVSMYTSEKIGAVLGQVKLIIPEAGYGVQKEVLYRDFEMSLKYIEGLFGSTIGAFGGFYSIRKTLFKPLPPNAYSNDDLLLPMSVLKQGYDVIFDREAVSTEDTAVTIEEEFKRRVRIGAGNFQSFFLLLDMLNPLKGKYCFFYVSHKVLRWFSPFILLCALGCNALLIGQFPYTILFYLQLLFYGLAALGAILSKYRISYPLLSPTYHFISMNCALFLGFFRYIKGIKSAVWQSTERI